MDGLTRESRLAATFVALADTLVAEYDVVELLQRLVDSCAELLEASAAGLLLADHLGYLELVASTSEESRLVDTMQVSTGRGPSVQCYTTGLVVTVPDITKLDGEWHDFRSKALQQGFLSAHAVPMRLRGTIIGTLTLFDTQTGELSNEDTSIAQALADIATIGILHERALRESDIAQQQLQHALNSRVVIEQAKGVIAQVHNVSMDEAFRRLRSHARSNGLGLHEVATGVVDRTIEL
jgi:GAF domain-containing protein